jgi:NADH-quinone oxidoreductase subunit G
MTSTQEPVSKVDEDSVRLTIDGKEVVAKKGELLITAAQKAGVFIPRFCYHDRLKPVGMCRMCLVEIEGVRGLPPACTTPVAEGMEVRFKENNVEKAQDGIIEFLLINHPLDCPVCDRGGECPLQDQTLSFGPGESRFVEEKRHWEKPIEISDHVLLDRERCIQCSRCTRFADDVAGDPLITFVERGGHTEVNTFPGDPFASHFSGNIVQICPVGALTAKPYRFNSRPWDLTSTETTCTKCSVGCKGVAQTSRNEMVRFLGVDSEPVNQGWLCDKGRYGFDFMDSENRIRKPFIKTSDEKREVNLNEAIDLVAAKITEAIEQHGPESICVLGGAHGTNEDAYLIAKLAKGVIGTDLVQAQVKNSLPADLVLSSKRARIDDLDDAKAVIVLGADIKDSLPVLFLRLRKAVTENATPLIEANSFHTSTIDLSSEKIDLVPGDEINSKKAILEALDNISKIDKKSNNKIVLIAGDLSPAQNNASYTELVQSLLENEEVYLLPSVSTSNVLGAWEMGLAPGLLPGRVAINSVNEFADWQKVSSELTRHSDENSIDMTSMLKNMSEGKIKVALLFGANPVGHFGDIEFAQTALEACETVIAIDCFENESSKYADVFIPSTVANEKDGTVTNIEGRVQRVSQVVAPQGNVYDDWKIADLIAQRLGGQSDFETVDDVTNAIARTATSFAHLTTGVLSRARDGAIVPVDENKDALATSIAPLVDTPSWEPIVSRAASTEDPLIELDREEHHPSANILFPDIITQPFSRPNPHSQHLNQYALRLIFVDSYRSEGTLESESKALSNVSNPNADMVRIHPKDIESISVKEDNLITLRNDSGSVQVRVIPDKFVVRGTIVASDDASHPLRKLVNVDEMVTDLKLEAI